MDLHLYIPALIVLGAAVVAFVLGFFALLASITDDIPSPVGMLGIGLGICGLYASPFVFLIGLGMQIAHWV